MEDLFPSDLFSLSTDDDFLNDEFSDPSSPLITDSQMELILDELEGCDLDAIRAELITQDWITYDINAEHTRDNNTLNEVAEQSRILTANRKEFIEKEDVNTSNECSQQVEAMSREDGLKRKLIESGIDSDYKILKSTGFECDKTLEVPECEYKRRKTLNVQTNATREYNDDEKENVAPEVMRSYATKNSLVTQMSNISMKPQVRTSVTTTSQWNGIKQSSQTTTLPVDKTPRYEKSMERIMKCLQQTKNLSPLLDSSNVIATDPSLAIVRIKTEPRSAKKRRSEWDTLATDGETSQKMKKSRNSLNDGITNTRTSRQTLGSACKSRKRGASRAWRVLEIRTQLAEIQARVRASLFYDGDLLSVEEAIALQDEVDGCVQQLRSRGLRSADNHQLTESEQVGEKISAMLSESIRVAQRQSSPHAHASPHAWGSPKACEPQQKIEPKTRLQEESAKQVDLISPEDIKLEDALDEAVVFLSSGSDASHAESDELDEAVVFLSSDSDASHGESYESDEIEIVSNSDENSSDDYETVVLSSDSD